MSDVKCRCGWDGQGDHPCHGDAYSCRKPAISRMLTYPTCLAGVQFKLGVYETFACDECWAQHLDQMRLHAMFLQIARAAGVRNTQGSGGITYDDDLGAWLLDINGEIRHAYYAEDPGDGGTHVPALASIDTSTLSVMASRIAKTTEAIKAIFAVVIGDKDPLAAELIGELKVKRE